MPCLLLVPVQIVKSAIKLSPFQVTMDDVKKLYDEKIEGLEALVVKRPPKPEPKPAAAAPAPAEEKKPEEAAPAEPAPAVDAAAAAPPVAASA